MDPHIVILLFDEGGVNPNTIYFIAGLHLLFIVAMFLSLIFGKED